MSFDSDFSSIEKTVKSYLRDHRVNLIEHGDIISEAYIQHVSSGEEYEYKSFVKRCKNVVFEQHQTYEVKFRGATAKKFRYNSSDNKYCRKCKETLPIESFGNVTVKNRNNIIIKYSYCKKCSLKEGNKYRRIRRKKHRELVTDKFVIETLMTRKNYGYSKEFILARPRLIEIERSIILAKRRKLLKKRN